MEEQKSKDEELALLQVYNWTQIFLLGCEIGAVAGSDHTKRLTLLNDIKDGKLTFEETGERSAGNTDAAAMQQFGRTKREWERFTAKALLAFIGSPRSSGISPSIVAPPNKPMERGPS